MAGKKSTLKFKTEVTRLLDIVIHSLYSHKEIFLRELISNASDAIDKRRFEALTNEAVSMDEEPKILITPDKDAGTLTVSDNGIGMDRDEIVAALGTIAHSGTGEFLKLLESKELKDNPELIGQFGVGFYASFMVADSVTVESKPAGGAPAVRWTSDAGGTFTVEEIDKADVGTDVILTMKDDDKSYLDEWTIKGIVTKYSDYIAHPVAMNVEKEHTGDDGTKTTEIAEETLNSMQAIWLKSPSEVSPEEYDQFYQHVAHDFTPPAKTIHFRAEGTSEFAALLFIPKRRPFDLFTKDYKVGPQLYVKRVQIMEAAESLLPQWLRFLKGVVDSSDLPLNVSREMLQNDRQAAIIRKNITKKVMDALGDMMKNDPESYAGFFDEFGRILKEGIHFEPNRKKEIADLLLLDSTAVDAGKTTTFSEYITRMKAEQDSIYYITGNTRTEAESSPYLEAFRDAGIEVLILTDEIDDLIMGGLAEYDGKKIVSAIKGDVKLPGEKDDDEEKDPKATEEMDALVGFMKDALKGDVTDVRLSGRLKDSAAVLVGGEGDLDPQMEQILKSMGQAAPPRQRTLELNPDHPLMKNMKTRLAADAEAPVLKEYAKVLYDTAVLLEGGRPKDPAAFARTIAKLMADTVS